MILSLQSNYNQMPEGEAIVPRLLLLLGPDKDRIDDCNLTLAMDGGDC